MEVLPPINIIEQQLGQLPQRPENPCPVCGFWRPGCNQSDCPIFKKYKDELIKLWRAKQGCNQ
jgi:hypothetical protein